MTVSRTETIILGILEFVGLCAAIYGLWFQWVNGLDKIGMFYCFVWYVLGAISFLLGLISIAFERVESEEDPKGDSQVILQYHYLTGWLSVVVGYPLMVNYTWLMLYPTMLAHLHLLLSIIPLMTWLGQSSYGIVRTTQLCTTIACISHFFVCFLAGDIWGWISAIVMIVNTIALSTPTKYHVWAFNSRELFVIGLVATSVLMNFSIVGLSDPSKKLK